MSVKNALGFNSFPIPVGSVIAFAGNKIPINYLQCNGQEISVTDYSELYATLGDIYGIPEASGNFIIPDLTNNSFIQGVTTPTGTAIPADVTLEEPVTIPVAAIPSLFAFEIINVGATTTFAYSQGSGYQLIDKIQNKLQNSSSLSTDTPDTINAGGSSYGAINARATDAVISHTNTAQESLELALSEGFAPVNLSFIYIIKARYEEVVPFPPAPPSPLAYWNVYNDNNQLSGFVL